MNLIKMKKTISVIATILACAFLQSFPTQGYACEEKVFGSEQHRSITLQPADVGNMEIRVHEDVWCSYPDIECVVGGVTYISNEKVAGTDGENLWPARMTVVSRELIVKKGTREHKVGLKRLKSFLDRSWTPRSAIGDKNYTADKEMHAMARAFDDCTDYACPLLFELDVTSLGGFDTARAFATEDGQGFYGMPTVRIIARKGAQYALITGAIPLDLNALLASCNALDEKPYYEGKGEDMSTCAHDIYAASDDLHQKLQARVDNLMTQFSLDTPH